MDSILTSIKKLLGIEEEHKFFDDELIIYINSVFATLIQLGLGPKEGFAIESEFDTWDSFLDNQSDLNSVKTYIYMKVRLMFDPPQMGYLIDAINKQCEELEWRLNLQVEKEAI